MNPNTMTPIGQLSATGSGEVRAADGTLLSAVAPPASEVRDATGHLLLDTFDGNTVSQETDA